ncbi:MAG: hypothetical protein ACYC0F_19180 [Rhodanobacter sp.]
MSSNLEVGIDPRNPLDYIGTEYSWLPCFKAPRRPTTSDNTYPLFSLWRVIKNPINGAEGEFWYLSKYSTDGIAIWLQLASPLNPTILYFDVDANTAPGTDPVVADNTGNVTITGGVVSSGVVGNNVIRTDSLAANTYTIEIQKSGSNPAVALSSLFGASQFDSNDFLVTDGFVQIKNFSPFNYRQISVADSPYTVVSGDNYLSVDPSGGSVTIRLPNSPTLYEQYIIKDRTGFASTNHILVTTVGGSVLIDNLTTLTMAGNLDAITILWNGTSYEVF